MKLRAACAAVLLSWAAQAEPMPAGLLARLAAHDALNDRWFKDGAYLEKTSAEELDGDGKVKSRQQSRRRIDGRSGKREVVVLSASKDGKDVTAEAQRRQAEADAKDDKGSELDSPFAASQQPRHFFVAAGTDASGLLKITFRPKGAAGKDTQEGEALVDAKSGEAVRIVSHPARLPTFVDKLEVELRFDELVRGTRVMSSLRFAGEGGLPFFKRRGGATITFSELQPPKE